MPRLILLGAGGGGGVFSPTSLSGLEIWLDADDATTITETANAVSQWDDKSGNGYNVTQGVGSDQPITNTNTLNGKNVINFNGSTHELSAANNTILDLDGTNPYTMFAVCKFLAGFTGSEIIMGKQVSAGDFNGWNYLGQEVSTEPRLLMGNINDISPSNRLDERGSTVLTKGTAFVTATTYDGSKSSSGLKLYVDGAEESTTILNDTLTGSTTSATKFTVGNREGGAGTLAFTGDIAELIIYNRVLTGGELQQVEDYLGSKWGITVT